MKSKLIGPFRGITCQVEAACFPKTAALNVLLVPSTGADIIALTQNLGQGLPLYQAFLGEGILNVDDSAFMDFAEANGLGHIVAYKRYDIDLVPGQARKVAAVFQFDRTSLMALDPVGCSRYEQHYAKLGHRHVGQQRQRVQNNSALR